MDKLSFSVNHGICLGSCHHAHAFLLIAFDSLQGQSKKDKDLETSQVAIRRAYLQKKTSQKAFDSDEIRGTMMAFSFHRSRYSTPSLSSASASTSSSAALSHPGSSIFTPLSFFDGEQDASSADTERPGGTGMDRDYDYVKWQGSQTACKALNQLIDSSKDESESMRARSCESYFFEVTYAT